MVVHFLFVEPTA